MPSIPPAGIPVSSYPKFNRTPTQLDIVEKLKEAQRLLEEETRHRQIAVDYVETKAMFFGAKVAITNVLHELCMKYNLYGVPVDDESHLPRQGGTFYVWKGAVIDGENITNAIDDLLTNETPTDGDGNALPSLADIHKVARDQLNILFINIIKYHELQIERARLMDQIISLCMYSIYDGHAPTPEVISLLMDKNLGPPLEFPFKRDGKIDAFNDRIVTMGYGASGYYGYQATPIIDPWITGHIFTGRNKYRAVDTENVRGNLRLHLLKGIFGPHRQGFATALFYGKTGGRPSGFSTTDNTNAPIAGYLDLLERLVQVKRFRGIPLNFKKVRTYTNDMNQWQSPGLNVYYATDTLISFYAQSLKSRKPEDFWTMCSKYRLVGELGQNKTVLVKLVEVDPKTSAPKGRGTIAGIYEAQSFSEAEAELGNAVSAVASMYHYILPLRRGEIVTSTASNMEAILQSQNKIAQSMWVGIPDKAAQPYVAIVREKWNWPRSFLQREKTGQWEVSFKPTNVQVSESTYKDLLNWASNDPKIRLAAITDESGNERLPESMIPLAFGPAKDIPGVNSITQIDFMLQPAGTLDSMRLIATPGINNPVMEAVKDVFFKRDIVNDTGDSFKVNIIQEGTTTSFEQKMVEIKNNLEKLQIVLTSPYLYLEGKQSALTGTVGNSGRSRYGVCISTKEMNFIKTVLDKARWPNATPKTLYSTAVDDVSDVPIATARMQSALSSTTSSPPKLAPLAELPPFNLQTIPSVDSDGNQYVTMTMKNGRGFPLPPPAEEMPRTLIYSNERSANGVHEMYTTYNYIWSRNAAGVYTGAKVKVKGTLPDVTQSRRLNPQQEVIASLESNQRAEDSAMGVAAGLASVILIGGYLALKNNTFFNNGD